MAFRKQCLILCIDRHVLGVSGKLQNHYRYVNDRIIRLGLGCAPKRLIGRTTVDLKDKAQRPPYADGSLDKLHKPQRPPGGGRPLVDPNLVFNFNNWDNVQWDEEQEDEARQQVEKNSKTKVMQDLQDKYDLEADHFWDGFYTQHQNRFFKDRHWLFTEFPELGYTSGNLTPGASHSTPLTSSSGDTATDTASGTRDLEGDTAMDTASGTRDLEGDTATDTASETRDLEGDGAHQSTDKQCQHMYQILSSSTSQAEASAVIEEPSCNQTNTSSVKNTTATLEEQHKDSVSDEQTVDFPGSRASKRILEVGCGVGNTVFPVLKTNNNSGLFVYCCDFSSTAVQLVKEHEDYDERRCHAFVCDVTDPEAGLPFPAESLDVLILIFVLSAIHPDKMQATLKRLAGYLKPGGVLLFRDYGRYDLAQLRFKDGKCLSDNFYVRGDGTRVYFFTQEELTVLFTKAGLQEQQNMIDRRLQVNRGRQLKMYRVWIQCKYRKPVKPS